MSVMDSASDAFVLAVAVLLLLETALNREGLLETIEVTRAKAAQKTTRGSSRGIGQEGYKTACGVRERGEQPSY